MNNGNRRKFLRNSAAITGAAAFAVQTTDVDVGRTYEVRGPFENGPF